MDEERTDRDPETLHEPVLVDKVLEILAPALEASGPGDGGGDAWHVDATLGLGGHAEAVLERFPGVRLFGVDRDERALELAAERLRRFGDRVVLARGRFGELEHLVREHGVDGPIRGLLADLGVSSMQIDVPERGFSFQQEGPLDMRMGKAEELTAYDVVHRYPEEDLAKIIKEYGDERHARRIAKGIAEARESRRIETTEDLAALVAELKPRGRYRPRRRKKPIHPATRVFQALRMEVNRELDELHDLLDQSVRLLEQEGRLAIISYHSGEDRVVKHTLRDLATGQIDRVTGQPRAETQVIEVLTKKPLRPGDDEVARNPRSRSARLRGAERI